MAAGVFELVNGKGRKYLTGDERGRFIAVARADLRGAGDPRGRCRRRELRGADRHPQAPSRALALCPGARGPHPRPRARAPAPAHPAQHSRPPHAALAHLAGDRHPTRHRADCRSRHRGIAGLGERPSALLRHQGVFFGRAFLARARKSSLLALDVGANLSTLVLPLDKRLRRIQRCLAGRSTSRDPDLRTTLRADSPALGVLRTTLVVLRSTRRALNRVHRDVLGRARDLPRFEPELGTDVVRVGRGRPRQLVAVAVFRTLGPCWRPGGERATDRLRPEPELAALVPRHRREGDVQMRRSLVEMQERRRDRRVGERHPHERQRALRPLHDALERPSLRRIPGRRTGAQQLEAACRDCRCGTRLTTNG